MNEFIKRWEFTRSESIELLKSLSDEQLIFKPKGEKWAPIYHQFGCIARTQLVYASAVQTGRMDFSLFSSNQWPSKDSSKDVQGLLVFLNDSDRAWLCALSENAGKIEWPDGEKNLPSCIS